jgi:hypothetical protein
METAETTTLKGRKRTMYLNLVKPVLKGLEGQDPEKIARAQRMCHDLAKNNNTTGIHVIGELLAIPGTNDLFKIVDSLQYSHPAWNPQVAGTFYGAKLKGKVHILKHPNTGKLIYPVGDTLYTRLLLEFKDFGKPDSRRPLSDPNVRKRRKKKQEQLDATVADPKQTLEQLAAQDKGFKGMVRSTFGTLWSNVKGFVNDVAALYGMNPFLVDTRDAEGVVETQPSIVDQFKARSIGTWYMDQVKERTLSEDLESICLRRQDDKLSMTEGQAYLYQLHAMMNWPVRRLGVTKDVEADLKLLCPLEQQAAVLAEDNLQAHADLFAGVVEKYGPADTRPIQHLLDLDEITLLDATRIMNAKPKLAKIRLETNKKIAASYKDDLAEVIEKIVPIYMSDKLAWHEDYRKGGGEDRFEKSIYAKALNKPDYLMMKELLWRAGCGKGMFMENLMQNYSMADFARLCENLMVLGRRMKFVENLAEHYGVDIRNAYDMAPEELDKIPAADLKMHIRDKDRNLKIKPLEQFSSESRTFEDVSLADVIRSIDAVKSRRSDPVAFYNFRKKHLPRIRAMMEEGLYHVDDIARLEDHYISTAKWKSVILDKEELSLFDRVIKGLRKMSTSAKEARDTAMVWLTDKLPDHTRRVMDKDDYNALKGVVDKALEYKKAMLDHGGRRAHERRANGLKHIVGNCKVYTGKVSAKQFGDNERLEVRSKALDLKDIRILQFFGDIDYFHPEKTARAYKDFGKEFSTLAQAYKKNPGLENQVRTLAGMTEGMPQRKVKRHLVMANTVFDDLQAIADAENQDEVYVSKAFIQSVNKAYQLLQQGKTQVNMDALTYGAQDYCRQHSADPSHVYNAFVWKGTPGRRDYVRPHAEWFRERDFGVVRGKGVVKSKLTFEQLADLTHDLAELNSEKNAALRIKLYDKGARRR